MTTGAEYRSILLLAGEHLWSALDALARWGDDAERVALVFTEGEDEEGGPLERLISFVREQLPHLELVLGGPVSRHDPGSMRTVVTDLADQGGPWLVNLSGTSGLMTVGAVLAGHHAEVTLAHRETDGDWYVIEDQAARRLSDEKPAPLERFDVASLIGVTWSDSERVARVVPARVEPELEGAALRALERHDLHWEPGFVAAARAVRKRLHGRVEEGILFEQYVVATLRGLGLDPEDLALGAKLFDGGIAVQEVDVVANAGGRLHVVDCKLTRSTKGKSPNGPPIGMQVREARTTMDQLGDGCGEFILLRPRMTVREAIRSLCEDYGLVVVDRTVLSGEPLSALLQRIVGVS